ncbi:hypothetical protein K458DRAFT_391818 [Lentithecium fluviatile CBS 122367]|uniref:Uncharacterized protein n=1 Tax=Lentithecium fluviatile CBS 122367 TaxID=1168545 RepID=A0A6G1IU07_9PLEO|nr:hypothetical protein K458DRAFT_391818 [Lentithecium fluviatile CBS 122367]
MATANRHQSTGTASVTSLKMEASQTAASWLSFAVTTIGLGSLISQASVITDKMDPFHEQPKLSEGFCGLNDVHLSRVPAHPQPGKAGWAVFLLVMHQKAIELVRDACVNSDLEKGMKLQAREVERKPKEYPGWETVPTMSLTRHKAAACISINRTTFLTLLCLTNARQVFQHSDAAGHRAAYASYSG